MKGCQIVDEKIIDEKFPPEMQKLKKIQIPVPDNEQLQGKADIFKALSDPTRLKIMYLLATGELCVCQIIMALDKPQSTISHHLNVLKNSGLIKGRKEGIWIHYSLFQAELVELIEKLTEKVKD